MSRLLAAILIVATFGGAIPYNEPLFSGDVYRRHLRWRNSFYNDNAILQ
jgi:hypothetical protein